MPIASESDAEDVELDSLDDGVPLSAIELVKALERRPTPKRMISGVKCFDHVIGGGIVPGSLTLICGSPGSGKTSMLLKVMNGLAKKRLVYYITGEEPIDQVALTMQRFEMKLSAKLQIAHDQDFYNILDKVEEMKPSIVVIDSVNTLSVDDDLEVGSTVSIKEALRELYKVAKNSESYKPAFIVIGHIRKDGGIAGPKALEHMVDANLFLQGSKTDVRRTLRCDEKNRFAGGPLPCWATFKMTAHGLIDLETHLEEQAREERENAVE